MFKAKSPNPCNNLQICLIPASNHTDNRILEMLYTVEPLLRGHPDERPPPLERPLDNVNSNINVLISTLDERPPLFKGHFSGEKGVASQEGFHCMYSYMY